ncbi:MAG: hypothetical protein WBC37_13995 [Burkholderiaceae bacterium]
MPATLQKINEQVIVITGATSGVGRVTARQAAKRGARLAPPIHAPEVAASAILFAAQRSSPRRRRVSRLAPRIGC